MDVTTLTNAEIGELQLQLHLERKRREASPLVDEARAEMVEELIANGTVTGAVAGDNDSTIDNAPAWVDPGTDHTKMYLNGAVVKHSQTLWKSEHPFLNHWEPGATGVDYRIWMNITQTDEPLPGEYSEWNPNGHAYEVGDRLTYNGATYEVVGAHTSQSGWLPDALPALYSIVIEGMLPEEETPAEVPLWNGNAHTYSVGDEIVYNGVTYKVVQAHTSQAGWTPNAVPSLYAVV